MCLAETCQISKLHAARQSFSSCVWLGRQRRPLNILLPASHQAGGAGGAGVTAALSWGRAGGLVLPSLLRDAFYVTRSE